jgi:hypothetical protein
MLSLSRLRTGRLAQPADAKSRPSQQYARTSAVPRLLSTQSGLFASSAGVLHDDASTQRAVVGGGANLRDIGEGLFEAGLAMVDLGDVDYQTIAGAVSTGTHGTGVRFGNLSTQVVGVRLVTGSGAVLEISDQQHRELLPAARLSLGVLGIITRITLQLQPRFELERRSWCTPVDWTLAHLTELQQQNRNMDFYWYPRSNLTQIRILNCRGEAPDLRPPGPAREHSLTASVRHVRFNDLIDPEAIRLDRPFGCVVRSPVPIVVQFARQDTRMPGALGLIGGVAFPAG